MIAWQPHQQGLLELVFLLRDAANPKNRDQTLINQRLLSFNEYPDYNAYLVYILARLKSEEINTRMVAGLQLKNSIKNHFNHIPLAVLDYVKQSCIDVLSQPDDETSLICKTVSSVIAAIVRRGQVHNWLQVISILIENLDPHQPSTSRRVQMSLDTLVMICEDSAPELDIEMQGGIRPLQYMIPKLLEFYSHPDPRFRVQAINATSQFVLLKQDSFIQQLDNILFALYQKSSDPNPHVRQEFGRMIAVILEAFPQKLEPYLHQTIEYMVETTSNCSEKDEEVVLGACDFWVQYSQTGLYRDQLLPYLPRLVQGLLKLMVYSDSDLLDIEQEHPLHIKNEDQSIRPRYYRPKNTVAHAAAAAKNNNNDDLSDLEESDSSEEESDFDDNSLSSSDSSSSSSSDDSEKVEEGDVDEEETTEDVEDDEFFSQDSLRQCSAAALDVLSVSFGSAIVTPLLNQLLNHTLQGTSTWLVRESGILALGAAAEGGMEVMQPYLDKLIPFLLKSMQDAQPLVRSISCWAISRFSNWLVAQESTTKAAYFEPVLFGLLNRLLDPNKRVQESACTAFIVLAEVASNKLAPYLYPILTHTNQAFALYKRKNRLMLYDAMGTLADAVGSELNQPQFIYLLMPPLITKWNELSDKDTDLFPLLECLSNITAALGPGFIQYVDPVLSRCVKLISSTLQEQILADQHPEEIMPPNVEFLIAALDLLSGIVQGLGPKIEPLIAQTNPPLLALLSRCIHDPVSEVLQSTFALLGDIAIASFNLLVPFLHVFIQEMIQILQNSDSMMISISVYNNVLWALGEMVMRWQQKDQLERYIPSLIQVLVPLLTHPDLPASIHENAMIALGRLGLACPQYMATNNYLKLFIKPWLEKSLSVREGEEKDSAFRGLCAMIKFNAHEIHEELYLLLVAISTWRTPSEALLVELNDVVKGYRQITKDDQWEYTFNELDPEAQKHISNYLLS